MKKPRVRRRILVQKASPRAGGVHGQEKEERVEKKDRIERCHLAGEKEDVDEGDHGHGKEDGKRDFQPLLCC